jgi:broad specificity phosphatase PhoE
LSADGVEQAARLAHRLSTERIEHVFASPFLRTVETAHHVAERLDRPIRIEPGLAEWLNPEWFSEQPDLHLRADLTRRFPRVLSEFASEIWPRYPEQPDEALRRAGTAARRIAAGFPGAVLLVGHGVSIVGAVRALTQRSDDLECALCSVFKLTRQDAGWSLELSGDVSHLEASHGADRFF